VDSNLLVQRKKTDDPSVIGPLTKPEKVMALLRSDLEDTATWLFRKRPETLFSSAWLPGTITKKVAKLNSDIVHLFWINYGFLRIESLKNINLPIVWTLHDMWPFTGGCHYDNECGRFRRSCGKCPILHSDRERDLSLRVWERKNKSWKELQIVVVATSRWMADMARASSLFKDKRIEVIPNGLDTRQYKPINKETARDAYNLPHDKKLILFSAFSATSDKRKGHQFLIPALKKISEGGWKSNAELVIIGASRPEKSPVPGMKIHYMGHLHDEISQVLLYSAADVLVAPSMQENLANTVMESLSCGTPVVAFNIGGMPDMIDHQINGYLVKPFEADDLAEGIVWVIGNKERHETLSQRARQMVEERYSLEKIASRYLDLYQNILK
jgi:glycosyltransferase involved in cell wall biosynthesis